MTRFMMSLEDSVDLGLPLKMRTRRHICSESQLQSETLAIALKELFNANER
jgi:hypothetical protein